MTTKKYIAHTDGGHGWLAVKRAELVELGILDKVSRYSYQRGDTVYLEEDCDASLFHHAKGFADCSYQETRYRDVSPVRSYAPFNPRWRKPVAGMVADYGGHDYLFIEPVTAGAWRVKRLDTGDTYRMRVRQIDEAIAKEV